MTRVRSKRMNPTADSGCIAEINAIALPFVVVSDVDAGLVALWLPARVWVFGRSGNWGAFWERDGRVRRLPFVSSIRWRREGRNGAGSGNPGAGELHGGGKVRDKLLRSTREKNADKEKRRTSGSG